MGRNEERHSSMRDRLRDRAEANKSNGGSSYLTLPEGVVVTKLTKSTRNEPTILDIVPYEVQEDGVYHDGKFGEIELHKGDLFPYRTILVHRKIGVDEKYYICPRTVKKPCPICEYQKALKKDPNGDEELAKSLAPQVKTIMNRRTKDGIELFEHSYANFYEKLEKELREGKEEWYDFAELDGGFTLEVVFSEESYMGNKYLEAGRIDFTERKDIPEKILDQVVNLDECMIILPYEKLDAIAFGDAVDTSKDSDDPPERDQGERTRERTERPEKDSNPEGRPGREGRTREPEPERTKKDPPTRERTRERTKEPDPEPEKKKESETKSRRTEPPQQKETKDGCPDGGEYGTDCNNRKFCMECTKWEACADEADRLKAK